MDDNKELVMSEEEILKRLLSSEADETPKKIVMIQRLGIPVTLRGLTGKELRRIREKCTYRKERRGQVIEKLDEEEFLPAIIVTATVSPNWGHQDLISKYKASGPEEVLKRLLLAGELDALADVVLQLSGFYENVDEIKN